MRFYADAKINLALDIVGKRNDGYHNVDMIMQQIGFCDILDIEINKTGDIHLKVENSFISSDETNIVFKAAKLFFEKSSQSGGCDIVLKKNIPVCAGMGGGSTDAAACLKGLNLLFGNVFDEDELLKISAQLGADVPFCVVGKTARASSTGEDLTLIKSKIEGYAGFIKPDIDIKTSEAYKMADSISYSHPDIDASVLAVQRGDMEMLSKNSGNVFEKVFENAYPEISLIKKHFLNTGASFSMMTGSGSTVFGIFEKKEDAVKSVEAYKGKKSGYGVGKLIN